MMETIKDMSNSNPLKVEMTDIMRDRILSGVYEIGEKLKEEQLSSEFCVSRTPVREVFRALENEGLVEHIPYKGCFARGLTLDDIRDIYVVRIDLEKIVLRWALDNISEKEIGELEHNYEKMAHYAQIENSRAVLELDKEFHGILYKSIRSRFLHQTIKSYKEYLDKIRKPQYYKGIFTKAILIEHREIINGVREKNLNKAQEAMTFHMRESLRRIHMVWDIESTTNVEAFSEDMQQVNM